MHVVERKDDTGSEEPAGAGGGPVVSEGSDAITPQTSEGQVRTTEKLEGLGLQCQMGLVPLDATRLNILQIHAVESGNDGLQPTTTRPT
jgi:hypothetical protein